mmetsp:Transcript_5291/g.15128  ORF Transcript_5291/g.15128 Transcript_5291/m.15128 type:complete len:450 (+) Transcript_5291:182-1531(+)
MPGNLKDSRINLGLEDVLGQLLPGLALRKGVGQDEDSGALVHDEHVVGNVLGGETLAESPNEDGGILQVATRLKNEAVDGIVDELLDANGGPALLLLRDQRRPRALQGHRRGEVVGLEVEVVDGGIGAERVVADPEVRVVGFVGQLEGQQQGVRRDQLGELVQDPRHEEDVAVLDGGDIDYHQVGGSRDHKGLLKLDVRVFVQLFLKREQNLTLPRLAKVELGLVEALDHLVHLKLGWPLLRGASLVQLGDKAHAPSHGVRGARGDVVPEEPLLHLGLPLGQNQRVEERLVEEIDGIGRRVVVLRTGTVPEGIVRRGVQGRGLVRVILWRQNVVERPERPHPSKLRVNLTLSPKLVQMDATGNDVLDRALPFHPALGGGQPGDLLLLKLRQRVHCGTPRDRQHVGFNDFLFYWQCIRVSAYPVAHCFILATEYRCRAMELLAVVCIRRF